MSLLNSIRYFILLLIFSSTLPAHSQEVDENAYGYKEVIEVADLSSSQIHATIIEWIAKNFSSDEKAIQLNSDEKIVVNYEFDLNPRIMRTSQNTTTKYVANGFLTFLIREGKFRIDMQIEDQYTFDGKKASPNSTPEILFGTITEEYIKILLSKGFMNVKQYGGFLSSLKTGDKKAKQADKYVSKELKKGVYLQRVKKLSTDLNAEVSAVYSSVKSFLVSSQKEDF